MTQNFGSPQPNTPIAPAAPSPFLGTFLTVADIPLDNAVAGNYADVDGGAGLDVERYIYDATDNKFVKSNKAIAGETAASVKQKYESNLNTNAFTNVEKTKLDSLAVVPSSIVNHNGGAGIKLWVGTQAEYDAITTKVSNTAYLVRSW